MTNELQAMNVGDLRIALDSQKVSAAELCASSLTRAEACSHLGAFITLANESAQLEAQAADKRLKAGERLPLLGVPIAIKDMICTRGLRTTCGSKILSNFIPPYDATVISKLRAAGAVIVGKTNMDEFAMGSSNETSAYGVARNPWDQSRVPGGSSGGSAVAVAAEITALSLGTDTGGSVRQPASLCGIVGLKPTYGRVSRYGVVAYASSLDQVGCFSRSVLDCATLSEVMCGHDEADATSSLRAVPSFTSVVREAHRAPREALTGLRVGMPKEYFVAGLAPEVRSSVEAAIKHLELQGASVVEVSLPYTEAALAAYYIIAPAEASSNLARYDGVRYGHRTSEAGDLLSLYRKSRTEGFGAEVQRRILIGTYVLSSGFYDAYYKRAQQVRTLVARDFAAAFQKCDVIACPAAPTPAFTIGEKLSDPLAMYLEDAFTIPVNLAGLPGIVVPCGFAGKLPIGLQLIGRPFDEETLFRTAGGYEATTSWHTNRPPLSSH